MSTELTTLATALAERYTLRREVGAGGMATVYLAEDRKHGRDVAIKVFRPELAAALGDDRFLKEVEVTARLQHPHIVPLFDSGTAGQLLYFVMPHVTGESLRHRLDASGRLGLDEAVRIVTAVAAALDYAHDHGVVHRDIKPENVLFQHGVPMVADFGIAFAARTPGDDRLTSMGVSLGTPAYMSPEQVAAEHEPDRRSDIYSLGCICYEMLAGTPPFTATTPRAVMAKHVVDTAPLLSTVRPEMPPGVSQALARALAKEPADRFATAGGFAAALASPVAALPQGVPSVLVMPFANMSPDPGNEYLSDGVTEEIITDLSRISALRVIARSSAMRLKGTERSPIQLAAELGCGYLVEGSLRRAGDSLRVTAQLVEAGQNAPIWAEKFSGTVADLFDMQEGVSRAIVAALELKLSSRERQALAERPITDARAQEFYLRAREELWTFDPTRVPRAIEYFKNGLELIGDNVLLYRGLAEAYYQQVNAGLAPGQESQYLERAEACAARIFELEPGSAHGYVAIAGPQLARGDVRGAGQSLKRAVTAYPNDPYVLQHYAHVLGWLAGRPELAAPLLARLLEVDPLSPLSRVSGVSTPLFAGRYDEAIASAEAALRLEPAVPFYRAILCLTLGSARRFDEARAVAASLPPARPDSDMGSWMAGIYQAAWDGNRDEVRRLSDGPYRAAAAWDPELPYTLAQVHAAVGLTEAALDWLDRSLTRGMINHPFMSRWDWHLDPIREAPGFADLMRRAEREWVRFAG